MIQGETALPVARVALAGAIWLAAIAVWMTPALCVAHTCTEADVAPRPLVAVRVAALDRADLEEAFWSCDYTATTSGMHATPVDLCSAVYEELKERKFGGDFKQLLEWWRRNKPEEHARQAAGRSTLDASHVRPTHTR